MYKACVQFKNYHTEKMSTITTPVKKLPCSDHLTIQMTKIHFSDLCGLHPRFLNHFRAIELKWVSCYVKDRLGPTQGQGRLPGGPTL